MPGIFPKLQGIDIQTCLRSPILLCLALLACEPAKAPHLVAASGTGSTRLVEGETIELRGTGFPEGRPAALVFRGELFRAGQPVERRFELTVPARALSSRAVGAPVTRELERAFCGVDFPRHTTFRGALEARFTPLDSSTPPVTGGLPYVVLDFIPTHTERETVVGEKADGERFARFAGLLLDEARTEVLVTGVMPDSAAERAGVLAGDELLALSGVTLLSVGDFSPPPRARYVELKVRRPRAAEPLSLVLDASGFAPIGPSALGATLGMMFAAIVLIGLMRSPLGRALSYLERCAVELFRSRAERPKLVPSLRRPERKGLRARLARGLPASLATYWALIPASALVMKLGLGRPLVALELDIPMVFAASLIALFVASLLFSAPRRRGFLPRVFQSLLVLGQGVPFALALAGVWFDWGALSTHDATLSQGAWPWEWYAFSTPVGFFAALVCLASLVPESEPVAPEYPAPRARDARRAGTLVGFVGFGHLFVASGIVALVFLGGTRLPSVAPDLSHSFSSDAFGAAFSLVKTVVVFCFVLALRALLSRVDVEEVKGFSFKVLAPLAFALLACVLGLRAAGIGALPKEVTTSLGLSSFTALLLLFALFLRRAKTALDVRGDEGVNPWI
jgi:NADH:ubiquinone oxidoreductase subunit H